MQIFKVFNEAQVDEVRSIFEKLTWEDGKGSARGAAKDIKSNWQAYPTQEAFSPITQMVVDIIYKSVVKKYAFAKDIVGLRANKYGVGDTYGWHVDMALMAGKRSDLSFTIFLSDADSYEGGELEMEALGAKVSAKPKAGEMIIYPTGLLHRVAPILKGERLGIVGWIESFVRDDEARNCLYQLSNTLTDVRLNLEKSEPLPKNAFDKFNQTHMQLLRILSK
jgi:PKHD-type hydroxylase